MRGLVYARSILGALLTAILLVGVVQAQIEEVQPEDFSADAVSLGFIQGYQSQRVTWGISYRGAGGGSLGLRQYSEFRDINIPVPAAMPLLSNEAPASGGSSGLPLVIDFAFPIRRVGLALVSGRSAATASIRVVDPLGTTLGVLEGIDIPSVDDSGGGIRDVAFGTSAPQGISKLVIDYGDFPGPELLYTLRIEFLSRPTFRTVIPQVARGDLEGGGRLETSISIVSVGFQVSGEIRFFDQTGQPLLVAGESSLPLSPSIDRGQFVETSDFDEEGFQGYAVIDSSAPVVASATYSAIQSDGTVFSEAGVAGTTALLKAVGTARERRRLGTVSPGIRSNDLRTALAVVNLSDEVAHVTVDFEAERVNSSYSRGASLELPPHSQLAAFLAALLFLDDEDLAGSLRVFSTQPLAVTTLQTRDGLPVASLPLAVADP